MERKAKFGGNAPVDLYHQIEDHQQAIALTEQVLANEISLPEWQEALQPLLVSLSQVQAVIDRYQQITLSQQGGITFVGDDSDSPRRGINIEGAKITPFGCSVRSVSIALGILLFMGSASWLYISRVLLEPQPVLTNNIVFVPTTPTPIPISQVATETSQITLTPTSGSQGVTSTSVPNNETAEPTSVLDLTPSSTPANISTPVETRATSDVTATSATTSTPTPPETTSTATAVPTDETVEPTSTTEPTATATDEPTDIFVFRVEGPSTVTVGDTFDISIIAKNIPDPGIFGEQFELTWNETAVSPVNDTLSLNDSFSLQVQRDIGTSQLILAASRQGDVDDISGDVTLLTWTFRANAETGLDVTTFSLGDWKFGRKGGVAVSVDQVVDLTVTIEGAAIAAGDGDIVGNVTGEGRANDNQAGLEVTITDNTAKDVTDDTGDFWINNAPSYTYSITANSAGFLAATCTDATHVTGTVTVLNDVVLLAGDIDNDGVIGIADAAAIGAVFGSTDANEVANLNADEKVDILDLILMAANYEQTSEANAWRCQ